MFATDFETQIFCLFPDGKAQCELITRKMETEILQMVPAHPGYTLIATGGLGRKEQGMYSDIDVLFLARNPEEERQALDLVKQFWDRDWKVGYSIRNLDNVWQQAKEDATFFTNILSSRFLAGDREQYEIFESQKKEFFLAHRGLLFQDFYPQLKALSFFEKEQKLFLNQPFLKSSHGGLRGFQIFGWFMAIYPQLEELLYLPEYRKAREGYFFLWAVRNVASMVMKRSIDQLQLDFLARVLEKFGEKKQFAGEEFLKKIFIASSHIYDLLLKLKEKLAEELPLKKKFFQFFKKKKEDMHLMVLDRHVYVKEDTGPAYLKGILYAVRSGFRVAEETLRHARYHFQNRTGFTPEELGIFREFFTLQTQLYHGFYYLHHSGFLPAFLPRYQEMFLRPQLDFYHSFTLAEHSLLTLKHLSHFYKNQNPLFSQALYELSAEEKETLVYSLLLHDIGKIHEGNHIENNKKIIDEVLEPLPLKNDQKEEIAFLVIHHLLMSNTCQHKDINRVKVVLSFSEKIGSIRRLRLLFLVTICDMMAVNDRQISSFIEEGLHTLYLKTRIILSKNEEVVMQKNEKEEIITSLKKKGGKELEPFLELFPQEYLFEVDNENILQDARILEKNKENISIAGKGEVFQIKYYGQDRPGILSRIVAGLTLSQLNILDARVYTLKNGQILDYFFSRTILKDKTLDEAEKQAIRQTIARCVSGVEEENLKKSFHNKLYYWIPKNVLSSIETRVETKELEDGVIYVFLASQDFPGILYFITDFFHRSGFSILKSKINTIGIRVYDGFYLKNLFWKKSLDEISRSLKNYVDGLRKELTSNSFF